MNKVNTGVFIGRFQPFHDGHANLIKEAFSQVDTLIVFIGSSNRHSSIKNPFSMSERQKLIYEWFYNEPSLKYKKMIVESSNDYLYHDWRWKSEIQTKIKDIIETESLSESITLFGHSKDASSYYLSLFPEWNYHEVPNFNGIDATSIRKTFFESGIVSKYYLPVPSVSLLHNFKNSPKYLDLIEEWKFYENEQEKFKHYPYPETLKLCCADAVVICYGKVLLIKRKNAPGKNTWALPGGFTNSKETFLNCCIRELREETNLKVPEKVLRGNIKSSRIFDEPSRTVGIPRITMAFHIDLPMNNDGTFPSVRQASDALEVKWFPLSDLNNIPLFDDHRDIINHFI